MNGNAPKLRRIVEKHETVGLDTAPLIYFIEDVPLYADLLEPTFTLLEERHLHAVTSTVTLAEILTKPLADKNFELVDGIKFALRSLSRLSFISVDQKLAEAAALLRARYALRLPDAIQIAVSIQSEAMLCITNDKRMKKVDAIEILVLADYL